MAIYLLPIPKKRCVERPDRVVATSATSTECFSIPELHAARGAPPVERLARWKALQAKGIKGVMRWM